MTRVGLVLGGGGAVGHGFHGGLLAALEETAGFDARTAEIIVGTSSGATVAGLVRAGPDRARTSPGRARGEISPRLADVDCEASASGARQNARRPFGSAESRRLRRPALSRRSAVTAWPGSAPCSARSSRPARPDHLGRRTPRPAVPGRVAEPTRCGSRRSGIDDGERVIFGRDGDPVTDVPTAVAASCALPGWFTPVVVADRRYIDGAVWSATNADVLADARTGPRDHQRAAQRDDHAAAPMAAPPPARRGPRACVHGGSRSS